MQNKNTHPEIRDYGGNPFVFNISHAANMNQNFRTTLWTGEHMQLTVMNIPEGSDIGEEMHPTVDQFICVESGIAKVYFGADKNNMREVGYIKENYAVIIPSGTWHNIVNVGNVPMKVYTIYAPPQHPFDTVHKTKNDASH